jgi:hypothetical protein
MIPRNLGLTIAILLLAVVGMGLYGLHLRKQALQLHAAAVTDIRPISPPISGSLKKITIFSPDDSSGTLLRREVTATLPDEPTMRARQVVHVLIANWQEKDSLHPISNSADVNTVFLLDNSQTAIIDVNAAFADQHRSGILVEELTLASIAKTVGANINGVTAVRFLVDGKERETLAGHADLTDTYSTSLDWRVSQ